MKTVQQIAADSITKRLSNGLQGLQTRLNRSGDASVVAVSDAQFKAMKTAFTALKASGVPMSAELVMHAKNLGLM